MSGLVPTSPGTAPSDAVANAISNALVAAQLGTKGSPNPSSPAFQTLAQQGFTPGQFVDVGSNSPVNLETAGDLVVVAGGNDITIDPNLRTDGAIPSGLTPAQERAFIQAHPISLDNYATVVVGGGSTITFTNDTVDPSFGVHVIAGAGNNVVNFNDGPDLFQGTTGNDSVTSGASPTGHDTIIAGSGNDTITLQAGNNSVVGASGNDLIFAGTGLDTINASKTTGGSESIVGGGGNTFVNLGTSGKAAITVDLGQDSIGNDTIFGNNSTNVTLKLSEGSGDFTKSTSTDGTKSTVLTFASTGQVIEVKHVNITFGDGNTGHF